MLRSCLSRSVAFIARRWYNDIMFSVTQRIRNIKGTSNAQPRGGFLPPKQFQVEEYDDGCKLETEHEQMHASLVGLAVDYLTRFVFTKNAQEAFDISLRGAMLIGELDFATKLIAGIEKEWKKKQTITDKIVTNTFQLCAYDVVYRSGPLGYRPAKSVVVDPFTLLDVYVMLGRTMQYLKMQAPLVAFGFSFSGKDAKYIRIGDGDVLTQDAIIDFKVSVKPPTSDHTLQLLTYYLMGLHEYPEAFESVNKIAIFNPRLNTSYTYDLAQVEQWVINEVNTNVIGYEKNY